MCFDASATLPPLVTRSFWKKRISQEELLSTAAKVQADAWKAQADAGIDLIGLDGTLYDQVSTMLTPLTVFLGSDQQLDAFASRMSDVSRCFVVSLLRTHTDWMLSVLHRRATHLRSLMLPCRTCACLRQ
jgi:Cobalamin-independent synthase, N-terminal domain